jgi:hypothetical protein
METKDSMMTKLPIMLDEQHAIALGRLARTEYRDMAQQAAVIIRDELIRRGFLQNEAVKAQTAEDTQESERTNEPTDDPDDED